jgi:hypothetical protein
MRVYAVSADHSRCVCGICLTRKSYKQNHCNEIGIRIIIKNTPTNILGLIVFIKILCYQYTTHCNIQKVTKLHLRHGGLIKVSAHSLHDLSMR